ncbi:MAG TPA: transporter substrate-binding domain-containing protein [Paucimonas sp.]|nr:transporter substrate-binding domain-containing protein [Paucimonas sp.]
MKEIAFFRTGARISPTGASESARGRRLASIFILTCVLGIGCAESRARNAERLPLPVSVIEIEPWAFTDARGRAKGIYVELTRALAREAGIEVEIKVRPYARVMLDMKTGASVFCFMFRNPVIEDAADAVAPVSEFDLTAVVPPASGIRTIEDLQGKSIAILHGTSFGSLFKDSGVRISSTKTPEQQLTMLQLQRVDAVVGIRETTFFAFGRMKQAGRAFFPHLRTLEIERIRAYLYVSKVHRSGMNALRLDQALKQVLERGELDAILVRYLSHFPLDIGAAPP